MLKQAHTTVFPLLGPVQAITLSVWPLGSLIPPVSDAFYPFFHWISSTFYPHINFHAHMCLMWSPSPTIIHLGDFFHCMAPVPSSNNFVFHQNFSNISIFFVHAHASS